MLIIGCLYSSFIVVMLLFDNIEGIKNFFILGINRKEVYKILLIEYSIVVTISLTIGLGISQLIWVLQILFNLNYNAGSNNLVQFRMNFPLLLTSIFLLSTLVFYTLIFSIQMKISLKKNMQSTVLERFLHLNDIS